MAKFKTEVENFYISYSDMVTLLLILFVYLFSVSEIDPEKLAGAAESMKSVVTKDVAKQAVNTLQQELAKLKDMQKDINTMIQKENLQDQVSVTFANNQLELNLGEAILFEPGKADLKPAATEVLSRIGKLFLISDTKVTVEGYTDNIPMHSPQYPSNWELSAARASSVVRLLQTMGLPTDRFIVLGRGETYPLLPNSSVENRAKNRRVKITLKPDLAKIKFLTSELAKKRVGVKNLY